MKSVRLIKTSLYLQYMNTKTDTVMQPQRRYLRNMSTPLKYTFSVLRYLAYRSFCFIRSPWLCASPLQNHYFKHTEFICVCVFEPLYLSLPYLSVFLADASAVLLIFLYHNFSSFVWHTIHYKKETVSFLITFYSRTSKSISVPCMVIRVFLSGVIQANNSQIRKAILFWRTQRF
jgi:hypothetical protein